VDQTSKTATLANTDLWLAEISKQILLHMAEWTVTLWEYSLDDLLPILCLWVESNIQDGHQYEDQCLAYIVILKLHVYKYIFGKRRLWNVWH
jgi:hypothetical protein